MASWQFFGDDVNIISPPTQQASHTPPRLLSCPPSLSLSLSPFVSPLTHWRGFLVEFNLRRARSYIIRPQAVLKIFGVFVPSVFCFMQEADIERNKRHDLHLMRIKEEPVVVRFPLNRSVKDLQLVKTSH